MTPIIPMRNEFMKMVSGAAVKNSTALCQNGPRYRMPNR